MANAKHTPGPWYIGYQRQGITPNANGVNAGPPGEERSIAQVYGVWSNSSLEECEQDSRNAEGLANARLVAAAPEMYEALCWLDAHIDFREPIETDEKGRKILRFTTTKGIEKAMLQARAAIAKAEGKNA